MINNKSFVEIQDLFINKCLVKYPNLKNKYSLNNEIKHDEEIISKYFKSLLGKHYVY